MPEELERKLEASTKQLVETNKALRKIATELTRMQRKIKGMEYTSTCCFKMLEAMTKDRKEKHKQHFAFMTVSLKVLEKIAKKLELEVKP